LRGHSPIKIRQLCRKPGRDLFGDGWDWEKRVNSPWIRSQAGFAGQSELYEALDGLVYSDIRLGEPESLTPMTEPEVELT
jgi:hypothetical protein